MKSKKLDLKHKKAYFLAMKKTLQINTLLFIGLTFFLFSCTSRSAHSLHDQNKLPRADSRYIGWLEKESIFRKIPEKIRIVSGTNFAWKFSSMPHPKKTIISLSPIWLAINPHNINTQKNPILEQIYNNTNILKELQIKALYIYPNKSTSFESLYNFKIDTQKQNISPISLDLAKELGSKEQYLQITQKGIFLTGNILPTSLGLGSDFLLALHGVREYPGLFMMQEIPHELWDFLPANDTTKTFSPHVASQKRLTILMQNGIIPEHFYRDFSKVLAPSGFAISNEITGYDGQVRRWIYRYVYNPYTAVLNFYDPSMNTQRMLSASIIQEVGIMQQGLVSFSIQDLLEQESISTNNTEQTNKNDTALFITKFINKSIHGYGAWSFCRDLLEQDFLAPMQQNGTDFVADSLFMPALEKAFLEENNESLENAFTYFKQQNIDEQALWHGSQKMFSSSKIFHFPSSVDLSLSLAKIQDKELSMLNKINENPLFKENNRSLYLKLQKAHDIQFAFHAFQCLLSGFPMFTAEEVLGIKNTDEPISINLFSLQIKNSLNDSILIQAKKETSLLSRLQRIWNLREHYTLSQAKIISSLKSSNKKIFAYAFINPKKKKGIIAINLSDKKQKTILQTKIINKSKTKTITMNPYAIYFKIYE